MDDLRSTSARIFYVRSICRMHHLPALFRASWLFVRPSGGVCCCLPLALRSRLCAFVGVRRGFPVSCVRRVAFGFSAGSLVAFVCPSGGVGLPVAAPPCFQALRETKSAFCIIGVPSPITSPKGVQNEDFV